jgi:LysR family glycine cleavage system transcriptional activator
VTALPPLNALRAFEAAARHLSFKHAAEELCVTQGAISRHIVHLENALSTRLFVRRHRQVELTPEGLIYSRDVRNAFVALKRATANLGALADDNTLRIKIPPTCAVRWFVPRLARFHAAYPDIAVQITTSHEPAHFDRDRIDVAIQYNGTDDSRLVCERLFGEVMIPVCSRHLAEQDGGIGEPRDVARHVLLKSIHRLDDWPRWFEVAGIELDSAPERELVLENASLTYEAAEKGLGIALAQSAFVEDELRLGRLVVPIEQKLVTDAGYYIVFPEERARLAKLRAFRAWLAREISPAPQDIIGQ